MTRTKASAGATPDRVAHADRESITVQVIKALTLMGAAFALLAPLATTYGLVFAAIAIVAAFVLSEWAFRRRLRVRGALTVGILGGVAGWFLSGGLRENITAAGALGVDGTVITSEALLLGVALFSVLFMLRSFAKRSRVVTVVEGGLIVLAAVFTFAAHRECRLNQPRWLSDFALSNGFDVTTLLMTVGVIAMFAALVMFMRRPDGFKAVVSMLVAGGVAAIVFWVIQDDRVCGQIDIASYAMSGDGEQEGKPDEDSEGGGGKGEGEPDKDKDGDGGGTGGGGGGGGGSGPSSENPYNKPPPQNDRPQPVVVVTFHDDYENDEGVLYFRQQVQSTFDQTHLTVDGSGTYDKDVITQFPTTGPVFAGPGLNLDFHKSVPTSVFMLADHPQPVGLTHATALRPLPNPNPQVFVAAYEATSHVMTSDYRRLLGRRSVPKTWTEETKAHYLKYPDDPRYKALSDYLVRDIDPRFFDDDLMKALVLKKYLEKEGFYTLKETHTDATDPTASFLFGSLRGYCVHFAHAAAFLFRSQGIASRVAVGYGVNTGNRSGGSNLLIMGNMAHAWPEIHLEGVGWVTFDVYPERSDEAPQQIIDQDLENQLGEMARNDTSGGKNADPDSALIPWGTIGWTLLGLLIGALAMLFILKWFRRLRPRFAEGVRAQRWALVAALDRFSDIGVLRQTGETRERFAARVQPVTPSLGDLTMAQLRTRFGVSGPPEATGKAAQDLYAKINDEYAANVPLKTRLLGALNPIGWLLTR